MLMGRWTPRTPRRYPLRAVKIAITSCPPDQAERIALQLVEERLVACVQALAVRSFYVWKGSVQKDEEVTLLLKVASDRVGALRDRLVALHPYELPEFVVLDVDEAGSLGAYVAWVREGSKAG